MVDFRTRRDRIFDAVNAGVLSLVLLATLYPIWFVLIASVSDPNLVAGGHVLLLPRGLNLEAYKYIFRDSRILRGYGNSLLYAAGQTVLSLLITMPAAYALSRRDMRGRSLLMFYFVFTMYFSGGMIPLYVLVRNLGMIDSAWALIVPNALNVFNLIIARTYFASNIPQELVESAQMDGCTNTRLFLRIVLPLAKAIVAIVLLYNVVQNWNAFFHALLFINDPNRYPLQLVLRKLLILNQLLSSSEEYTWMTVEEIDRRQFIADLLRYGIIVVSIVPLLVLYPFVQKYFVQGVMVGSIKG